MDATHTGIQLSGEIGRKRDPLSTDSLSGDFYLYLFLLQPLL